MQTSNHILAKEGILVSFAIAKKITQKEIDHIKNKVLKNSSINKSDVETIIQNSIFSKKIQSEMENIPGLLMENIIKEEENQKKMMELTYFSSLIAKKMKEKKINKFHSCYIINTIVNLLGLTEEDFDEFHDKFKNEGTDSDTLE